MSSEPSIGQIVPLVPSCALATGAVKIGPRDASNITVTSITALALVLAGPTGLMELLILAYPNSMVYEANARLFEPKVNGFPGLLHLLTNQAMLGHGSHKGQTRVLPE